MEPTSQISPGIGIIFALIIGVIGLATTAFWIWMLVSAITNKGLGSTEKICWVLAIFFLNLLGAILYFFIGHPKRLGATAG